MEKLMNITPEQRRTMWRVGLILLAVYFIPSIIGFVRHAMLDRQQRSAASLKANPRAARPLAGHGTPPAVPPAAGANAPAAGAAAAASAPDAAAAQNTLARFLGKWQGGPLLTPGSGACTMRLEIRENEGKQGYVGYSATTCVFNAIDLVAANAKGRPQDAIAAIEKTQTPNYAVLVGSAAGDSIQFQVDKNLGNGCGMTVMSFGTDQIAAELKGDASCQGGHMVLRKAGQ
jgi:hypothetical protein